MKHSLLVGVVGAVAALTLGSGVASGQGSGRLELAQQDQRRPRLGVTVDIRARDTDSVGAFIEAVLPESPAAKAGIRAGDIITKIDGRTVGSTAASPSAGMRLVKLATRLKPNVPISVELRRGNVRKAVSVVAPPELTLVFQGSSDEAGKRWSFTVHAGDSEPSGQHLVLWLASPLSAIETAALNTELGEYFGTTQGVLVINCPQETGVKLEGGDIILAVNGRKPSDPGHFMRLLQQRDPGLAVRFAVLRHRKRLNITVPPSASDSR